MIWNYKENLEPERVFKELSQEFGLNNLLINEILTADPDVDQLNEGQMRLVNNSGTLQIVVKFNGSLKRVSLS